MLVARLALDRKARTDPLADRLGLLLKTCPNPGSGVGVCVFVAWVKLAVAML